MTLVDELLPVFDVSDELAVVVDADTEKTWAALTSADLIEVGRRRPLVGVLGALRVLPEIVAHLLHGEAPPPAPARLTLRDTTELPANGGGWILLGELPGEPARARRLAARWAIGETGAMSERNPGFSADEAREIGERIGIDWDRSRFDVEQFRMGLGVELEHGRRDPETNVSDDDELTTGKIARAHLNEFPDYYTRLAKMEAEAEHYWADREP